MRCPLAPERRCVRSARPTAPPLVETAGDFQYELVRTARAGAQEATPCRHGVRTHAPTPDLSVEPFAPAICGPREPRPARVWQMGPAEMELDDPELT